MKTRCFFGRSCRIAAAVILISPFARAQDHEPAPARGSNFAVANADAGGTVAVPVVSLSASRAETREPFCDPAICDAALPPPGIFLVSRHGGDLAGALSVLIQYTGDTVNGTDYEPLPELVTIPAGQESVELWVNARFDERAEGDETVRAELQPDPSLGPIERYRVSPEHAAAEVVIHDNEQPPARPVIRLELVQREAMETLVFQNAIFWAEFRVVRTGDLVDELEVFLNTHQGSARFGEDYWLEGVREGSAVRFPAGAGAVTVRLFPIDDDLYEGDEPVFFHLLGPPPGTPETNQYDIDHAHSSVSMVIHDNDPVTTRLEITVPRNGDHFEAGDTIQLRAHIIGPDSGASWTVEFFDGEHLIGTTQPGAPLWWRNAIGGTHVIRASAARASGVTLRAEPVTISVGPGPALPVVSVGTFGNGRTAEPCPVCLVAPAYFLVSRTGSTHEPLNVYLEYDGPATAGEDYEALPHRVTIPAGTNAALVLVLPLDDRLAEGPEIVRATLAVPELVIGGYLASFYANQAAVVIFDDEADAPEIRLDLADPDDGAQFAAGATIEISALGVWTRGEVDRPVQFFAGDTFIGQSNPPLLGRPTIPGLPSVHTIFWTNPPPGEHVLTARFEYGSDLAVTSPPVSITVGEPAPVRVRIEATRRIAEESSHPLRRLPLRGEFTVSRTGPTNHALSVFVQYSGTATPGTDVPFLPFHVTIPAGATATQIEVVPVDDGLPEGIELLVAALSHCPPATDPPLGMPCVGGFVLEGPGSATVFIRDDGVTEASLLITKPHAGARFELGDTILIDAIAIDLNGCIGRVGFWDATVEQQIGYSQIEFFRAPDPGTPILHSFAWNDATAGPHVLEARVIQPGGTFDLLRSPPVRITVGPDDNQPPQIQIVQPVPGTDFPPDALVEIVAEVRDPDGYVRLVEFFADDQKIGEVTMDFFRAPDPGQLQTFTFTWHEAVPGSHVLTARATDNQGAIGASAAVAITVATTEPLPIVMVTAPDPVAVEPDAQGNVNSATFRIRRFGATNEALVVTYWLHGTAENGIDFETLPGLATIPAGQRSVAVVIRPLADELAEGIETLLLRLEPPPPPSPEIGVITPYRIGRPKLAVALIRDEPSPMPPRQARCVPLPGNLLHLSFDAAAGHSFRLEVSSDFLTWEAVFEAVSADGAWHFIATDREDEPRRFYRLVPAPGPDD